MRGAFVLLLIAVAGGLGFWFWSNSSATVPAGVEVDVENADPGVAPATSGDEGAAPAGGALAVPTRTLIETPAPDDLADRPTACLRVVDHDGGQPIVGAVVRRMKDRAEIGFTDEQGLAELPLREREQLEVLAERYLRRMAPTRLGSTRSEPQKVSLVRDQWSAYRRIELRTADDARIDEAFVHITPGVSVGRPPRTLGPPSDDAVVRRAQEEDARLWNRDFGVYGSTHLVADGELLRFVRDWGYSLEFATAAGLVQRSSLLCRSDDPALETLVVQLAPGATVAGVVFGNNGRPLADATIQRPVGDPLGLKCTTGADGRFVFGPVPSGPLQLIARHPDHEPATVRAIDPGRGDLRITLTALPGSTLRGSVRARPDLEPISGAVVSWTATADPPITATTAADGTFRLATKGEVAGRLLVSARGYLPLVELVAPGAPFADYDLLPATTADRLAAGMTAVLAGSVLDRNGQPIEGAGVRWVPGEPAVSRFPSLRRMVSGHVLDLPLTTMTRADGSFELETARFGRGTLRLLDGGHDIATEAVAGQRKDGHRFDPP